MNSQDWKAIGAKIMEVAPLIGGILGGPSGTIVGTISRMLAGVLGVNPTPAEVDKVLKDNPEALLKIRELELAEATNLRQAAFDMERLAVLDRINARKTHGSHWMTILLPIALLGLVSFISYYLMTDPIPSEAKDMIFNIISQLLTMTVAAVSYWIGTTRSSAMKTELLGSK